MSYQTSNRDFTNGSGTAAISYTQAYNNSITETHESPNASDTPKKGITYSGRAKIYEGELDRNLLTRILEIIESLNPVDIQDTTINLESLHGIILELWESAMNCSQCHQDILALVDNALISIDIPTAGHISILREAILDLMNQKLSRAHVEVLQRQFTKGKISPLALMDDLNIDE